MEKRYCLRCKIFKEKLVELENGKLCVRVPRTKWNGYNYETIREEYPVKEGNWETVCDVTTLHCPECGEITIFRNYITFL